jgi:hypothetical protein
MYAKLFTSIYQGTLRGNSHGLLVFTNLLAHCDKLGCVDMHPRAIAEEVGLSPAQVRAALDELEAPDSESRSPENEGRRIVRLDAHRAWGWTVVNYAKYRAIRDEDDRREQNRLSQERWRNKQKQGQSAPISHVSQDKPQSAHTEAEADTEADTEAEKKKARKRAVPRPEDVSEQVWSDWLALRKQKRAPVTQTVVEGAITEAGKAGMTLEAFLRVWCSRGSQGLEASWLQPHERGAGKPINRQLAVETENRRVAAEWLQQGEPQ